MKQSYLNHKSDTERLLTLADALSGFMYGDPAHWQSMAWEAFTDDAVQWMCHHPAALCPVDYNHETA